MTADTSACAPTAICNSPGCRPKAWPRIAVASTRWPSAGIAMEWRAATSSSCAASSTNCFAAAGATMRCWRSANWRWSAATTPPPAATGSKSARSLRDPDGQPLWLALRDVDLDKHWPEIERRWHERTEPARLARLSRHQLDLADVRARLILASIRAGELDRAALELDVFRRLHPNAAGRFGGQEGPVRRGARTTSRVRRANGSPIRRRPNWPTFAGSQSRSPSATAVGPIARSAWERPIPLAPPFVRASTRAAASTSTRISTFVGKVEEVPAVSARESDRRSVVSRSSSTMWYCLRTRSAIHAVNLATGKPAITTDGINLSQCDAREPRETNKPVRYGGIAGLRLRCAASHVERRRWHRLRPRRPHWPRLTPSTRQISPAIALVGIDLNREGLLHFASPAG